MSKASTAGKTFIAYSVRSAAEINKALAAEQKAQAALDACLENRHPAPTSLFVAASPRVVKPQPARGRKRK